MSDYKKIVTYVDQLHRDLNALMVVIEKLMLDRGFVALPSLGNRASLGLRSQMDRPDGWRLPNAFRIFMPEEAETFEQTLFYFIHLSSDTAFDFPPVICGRLHHPPLTESEVWGTFYIHPLSTLAGPKPAWENYKEEGGWTFAEPAHQTLATQVQVYVLNLFDLENQTQVAENLVTPLVEEVDLDEVLTIPKYSPV